MLPICHYDAKDKETFKRIMFTSLSITQTMDESLHLYKVMDFRKGSSHNFTQITNLILE